MPTIVTAARPVPLRPRGRAVISHLRTMISRPGKVKTAETRLGPAAEPLGRSHSQTARRSGRRVPAWKAIVRGLLPRNTSL
jgi:hypothetical protein